MSKVGCEVLPSPSALLRRDLAGAPSRGRIVSLPLESGLALVACSVRVLFRDFCAWVVGSLSPCVDLWEGSLWRCSLSEPSCHVTRKPSRVVYSNLQVTAALADAGLHEKNPRENRLRPANPQKLEGLINYCLKVLHFVRVFYPAI